MMRNSIRPAFLVAVLALAIAVARVHVAVGHHAREHAFLRSHQPEVGREDEQLEGTEQAGDGR